MSEEESLRIICELLAILKELHFNNILAILHRDINPKSILFDANNNVVLGSLKLATLTSNSNL